MTNGRSSQRFPLELPIKIRRAAATTVAGSEYIGATANLSASGVLLRTEAEFEPEFEAGFAPDTEVEFEIVFPAMDGFTNSVLLKCEGRVVRRENGMAGDVVGRGIACVIDCYRLVR